MADGDNQERAQDRSTATPVAAPTADAATDRAADVTPAAHPRVKASWAMIGIFLIMAGAAFIYAKAVLMPTVFALLLALTFSPVRRAMEKLKIPSGVTAGLITIGLLATLIGTVAGISAPLTEYVTNAPELLKEAEVKLRTVSETVEQVQNVGAAVEVANAEANADIQKVSMQEPGIVAKVAGIAPFILAQTVLTLVLFFFILASGDMFYEKIVHSIGSFKDKRRAVRIIRDIEGKLSRYFFTITVINAGLGLAVGLAMWALDMPHPYLFGIFAFVFNFIPYLGAIGGVLLAVIIGIISYDEVGRAFLAGLVYFSLTSFEGQFITPYAVGKSLKLNTVVVFLAVALWGWMWSVVGMIVAMPILIAARALSDHIPALYGFGDFLSARGAEIETAKMQAKEQANETTRAADSAASAPVSAAAGSTGGVGAAAPASAPAPA